VVLLQVLKCVDHVLPLLPLYLAGEQVVRKTGDWRQLTQDVSLTGRRDEFGDHFEQAHAVGEDDD
jgi:hypothetical protein